MLTSKVAVDESTLPLTGKGRKQSPQNLDLLCLQLRRMALVHVVHLSIQQLAACISSLLKI